MDDFEDALVTRNIRDYSVAPLTILTPAEALARLPSAGQPPMTQ